MKATGVVRRIDDLGRVVIPKEIRRTLRIKEGDPLEIFTDKEGEVILKKYSPIGELSEFAAEYAETLTKTTGHIACITDKDTVIAVSGASKKEWLEQGISRELERILEDKEKYVSKENNDVAVPITQSEKDDKIYKSQVIYPIISDGDAIGSVILLSKDEKTKMSEVEQKVGSKLFRKTDGNIKNLKKDLIIMFFYSINIIDNILRLQRRKQNGRTTK